MRASRSGFTARSRASSSSRDAPVVVSVVQACDGALVQVGGRRAPAHHGVMSVRAATAAQPRETASARVVVRRVDPTEQGSGHPAGEERRGEGRPAPQGELSRVVVGVDRLADGRWNASVLAIGSSPPWNAGSVLMHRGAEVVSADPRAGVAEQCVGAVGVEGSDRDDRDTALASTATMVSSGSSHGRPRRREARAGGGVVAGRADHGHAALAELAEDVVHRRVEELVLRRLVVVAQRQAEHVDRVPAGLAVAVSPRQLL